MDGIETEAGNYAGLIAVDLRLTEQGAPAVDPAVEVEARHWVDETERLRFLPARPTSCAMRSVCSKRVGTLAAG